MERVFTGSSVQGCCLPEKKLPPRTRFRKFFFVFFFFSSELLYADTWLVAPAAAAASSYPKPSKCIPSCGRPHAGVENVNPKHPRVSDPGCAYNQRRSHTFPLHHYLKEKEKGARHRLLCYGKEVVREGIRGRKKERERERTIPKSQPSGRKGAETKLKLTPVPVRRRHLGPARRGVSKGSGYGPREGSCKEGRCREGYRKEGETPASRSEAGRDAWTRGMV